MLLTISLGIIALIGFIVACYFIFNQTTDIKKHKRPF